MRRQVLTTMFSVALLWSETYAQSLQTSINGPTGTVAVGQPFSLDVEFVNLSGGDATCPRFESNNSTIETDVRRAGTNDAWRAYSALNVMTSEDEESYPGGYIKRVSLPVLMAYPLQKAPGSSMMELLLQEPGDYEFRIRTERTETCTVGGNSLAVVSVRTAQDQGEEARRDLFLSSPRTGMLYQFGYEISEENDAALEELQRFVTAYPSLLDANAVNDLVRAKSQALYAGRDIPGDLDRDGDVDALDLNVISGAIQQRASAGVDDERDLNGDRAINALDQRKLVTLCTRPRCAIQ